MKTSLFTTIGLALIGAIVAFVITNVVVPDLEPYSFDVIDKAQDSSASSNGYDYSAYTEPNEEVFNYKALNPTVEVHVGQCQQTDANGNCLDPSAVQDEESEEDENNENGEEDTSSEENGQENG